MDFAPKSTHHILNTDKIVFPNLNESKLYHGCDLIIDSGVDTCCAGKHTWATGFIQGVSVSYQGFSDNRPIEEDLPLANVVYAYDCAHRGETLMLHINYCIYMGVGGERG